MTSAFCINCGAELANEHQYCPRCGTERWVPAQATPSVRPPPGPGSQSFHPVAHRPAPSPRFVWLPFVFAAGAVFWLIELTQFAAVVAAPAGRAELQQALVTAGVTQNADSLVIVESAVVVLFEVVAVALHAAAYFGLRKMRPWGWICGVIVAAGWSLVLVGIPVLVILLRRTTRESFGIT